MLYQAYQTQSDLMSPFRLMAQAGAASFWLAKTEGSMLRKLAASFDVFSRLRLTHTRPAYGIQHITVAEHQIPVTEHKLLELPFGTLLHLAWFEKNLISHVPMPHVGYMRRVYPGFIQLSAFMSMNPERHKNAFKEMYQHLVNGDVAKADIIRVFYDEYLAVNDLPAEFYLETVSKVFQTYDLARGALTYRDRIVDLAAIRRTALMTVEAERDDICSVGQTVAAQDLCPNIRPYLKTHHIQTGVGHYGVFSGKKWNQQIYPRVREHIHASMG